MQRSVTQAIMWLPLISQTFRCPRLASSTSFSQSSSITNGGLFLLVSYDVLWPCSGSRTVTVLSLCHLIDTLLLVTCTHNMTINQVTDSSSPQPCAPAYVSCEPHKGGTQGLGNATSHMCQTIIIIIIFSYALFLSIYQT